MSNESATSQDKNDVTEETPAVITKELIEGAVRQTKGSSGVTLANYAVTKGSEFGAGFMTSTFVVDAEVKDGESTEATSIFIKTTSNQPMISQWATESGVFKKELAFYGKIVPDLVKFRRDHGNSETWNPPIPKFYGGFEDLEKKVDVVMIENLRPLGFGMANIKKGLDYGHCQLVLKAIAEMHAMSFSFIKTAEGDVMADKYGDVTFDVYLADCWASMWEDFNKMFSSRLDAVISKLQATGSPVATDVEKLSAKLRADPAGVMKGTLTMPAEPFGVICHGDLWTHNMLFRYEGDTPVEVKLIDWQIWRHCLPTTDIALFLFVSTTKSLRRQHLDDLLRLYHVTFLETLRGANVQAPDFTFDAFKEMFMKTALFGVVSAFDSLPGLLADKKAMEDVENMDETGDIYASSAYDVGENEILMERLMGIVEDIVWLGLSVE